MTEQNKTERIRIDNLLREGRITIEDHAILLKALGRRPRFFENVTEFMFNPFMRLSTTTALIAGVLLVILISALAAKLAVHFPGVLDFQVIGEGKRTFSFFELLVQNLINGFSLAVTYFAAALLLRQRNLRFIDFAGTALFARLPYVVFLIILLTLQPLFPEILVRNLSPRPAGAEITLAILALGFLAWKMTLMFAALKESSGLKGKALWLSYVGGLAVAEAISYAANAWVLN